MQQKIVLPKAIDWHLHVRDGKYLKAVIGATAKQFSGAIIMPNLKPPVTTPDMAAAYRGRILEALSDPDAVHFNPLMTLYLTDNTRPEDIRAAVAACFVPAAKYYPAGATTNSDSGVTAIEKIYPILEVMEEVGMVLCVHGEVTDSDIDVFDREYHFIWRTLAPLVKRYPRLKIVMEHVTTADGVDFVLQAPENVAMTFTCQHLLLNRNAIFAGGVRPHYYCLPPLKRKQHQAALLAAATSGNPKCLIGTDSAPHARHTKEADCGCAGCFTAPFALEFYATAFERAYALDKLPKALSAGAVFYGLPPSKETVMLVREEQVIPSELPYGDDTIVPLMAGEKLPWRLAA